MIDLKVADVTNMQSITNRYVFIVHSNSALRPKAIANYVDKKKGSLGVIHMKSKATCRMNDLQITYDKSRKTVQQQ